MSDGKFWRSVEEAVSGRLSEKARAKLFEKLRTDEKARADYDLTFDAIRELEQAPVSDAELDLVESWLMADVAASPVEAAASWWSKLWSPTWIGVGIAAAAAVALVVALPSTLPEDDEFGVRGSGDDRALAIDALCPKRAGGDGLVPAAEYGCALSGTLSFAYRVDPTAFAGSLSLFGVDTRGDVQYYAPTPADAASVAATPGTWQPLPMVVTLDVNHEAGDVVLYGLLSAQQPTVDQIDALAAALSSVPKGQIGDPAWHRRLDGNPTLAKLCPTADDCESAELTFDIREDLR
ncbi:MAG: hypothetical protein AAGA54_23700 [Myxococcota bacterium]